MSDQESGRNQPEPEHPREYPLHDTAAALNDRLGLYLSAEQQRGLATGLLVGAALGAAILAWGVVETLRGEGS